MSVFQLQDWWTVKVAEDEEFDVSCFGVGNVDNAPNRANKIVIGSLKGMLRIYYPSRPNFRVEDLVLEEDLGKPILQVLLGRFIPGSEGLGIAVLHPRELVVFEVIPQVVKDDRVSYYTLRRAYKHELGIEGKHFTAFNMICGPFGGVRGRDMILVQSIDGKLQIFEQSAHSFSRQLLDCLIPGPLRYVPKRDAFVTVNYAGEAECYLYQTLAASQSEIGGAKSDKDWGSFGLRGLRSTNVEWSLALGESCRDILLGNFSLSVESVVAGGAALPAQANELVFVCDKSLFLVKAETGGVIQQRRLDRAEAAAAASVPFLDAAALGNSGVVVNNTTPAPRLNFLVAGRDGTVQVFANFQLVWAARLSFAPVHVEVASFGGMHGLVVAVDDAGALSVSYLGTRPPVQAVLSTVRELDYDKVDEEHRALLQVIRDAQSEHKSDAQERLLVKAQLPRTLDVDAHVAPPAELSPAALVALHSGAGALYGDAAQCVRVSVRFFFAHNAERALHNVSVSVAAPAHVVASPAQFVLSRVGSSKATPLVQRVAFFARRDRLPAALDVTLSASYANARGEPQVVVHKIALPLALAMRPRPPSKSAMYKLVLDTEHAALPLTELFNDVVFAYQQAGALDNVLEAVGANAVQAMGFQLFCAPSSSAASGANSQLASILVSKNAGRYRLQADSYELLALLLHELATRLQSRLNAQSDASLALSALVKFNDALPVDEFFALVHAHLVCRLRLQNLNAQLNDAAHQFRLVEKRLLVRFKDRNPTPLHGLDVVFKESYDRIIALSDEIQAQQQRLQALNNEIDCFARLMADLVSLKYGLSANDHAALLSHLCPEVKDGLEQGWEETVHASLTHLLKTTLGKNTKESVNISSSNLEIPKNVDALKKSFLLVVDRIEKGGRLLVQSSAVAPSAATAGPATSTNASSKSTR